MTDPRPPAAVIRTNLSCKCGAKTSGARLPPSSEVNLFMSGVAASICSQCHCPIQVKKGAHLELVSA